MIFNKAKIAIIAGALLLGSVTSVTLEVALTSTSNDKREEVKQEMPETEEEKIKRENREKAEKAIATMKNPQTGTYEKVTVVPKALTREYFKYRGWPEDIYSEIQDLSFWCWLNFNWCEKWYQEFYNEFYDKASGGFPRPSNWK